MSDIKEEILYKVHNNLYVNLTNKCPCSCTFCLRQNMDRVGDSDSLWLDHEPDYDEVVTAFNNKKMDEFNEVVFCGFGEPTEAFATLVKVADFIKKKYKKNIRLNTNGLGNLINNRDICPELKDRIDTVSISLNTPDAEKYYKIVRPKFGKKSFQAMLDFAKESAEYVPNVIFTTVDTTISHEEEKKCQTICDSLGVTYRIRPWED